MLMAPLLGAAEIAAVLASGLPDADAVLVSEIARREQELLEFYALLKMQDRITKKASQAFFLRGVLQSPPDCSWKAVRDSGSDMAMLNLTRLDFAAFRHILAYVDPNWGAWRDGYTDATRTARRPGRPHNLDGASCIALVLAWLSTTAQAKYLELVFGCTHTDVSRDLEDGIQELLAALRRCPDAEIMWPTREEMNIFSALITCQAAYGLPPLPFSPCMWTDGLRLTMLQKDCPIEQNLFYNGWTKTEGILCLLTFLPNGRICHANLNLPNKFNDRMAAVSLVQRLRDPAANPDHHTSLTDVGFASVATNDVFTTDDFRPEGVVVTGAMRQRHIAYVKRTRQPAEWGMRVIQGAWCRLKNPLPTDTEKRKRILEMAVRLHNVVASCVNGGHNQIRSVYYNIALRA
jgi:hypothetical protein